MKRPATLSANYIKCHRTARAFQFAPKVLCVLFLLSGLLTACKNDTLTGLNGFGKGFSSASKQAVEAGRNFFSCGNVSACLRNYAIEKGLLEAKHQADAAGLNSISVDLNQFTHRKIKKVCLQTYAMWGIGSEEQQQQEFEKDAGESLGKASDWHKEGYLDNRMVIFFIRGEPSWFEIPDGEGIYLGNLRSICTVSSFLLLSESKQLSSPGLTSPAGRSEVPSPWTIQWSERP